MSESASRGLPITTIQALLRRQFPDVNAVAVAHIDEGGDYQTVAVDDRLIFRLPKDGASATKLAREMALLPVLAPLLPIRIPTVTHVGRPSAGYPHAFEGYPIIRGMSAESMRPASAQWQSIAVQLAETLSRLHAFPVERAAGLGVPTRAVVTHPALLDRAASFAEALRHAMPEAITPATECYLRGDVAVPMPYAGPAMLCHADLKGEHILLSDHADGIAGILDWSDAYLTDPAEDFAGLQIWLGDAFVSEVLVRYCGPLDPYIQARSRFVARCSTLINLGELVTGMTDAPLDLLLTQLHWAYGGED